MDGSELEGRVLRVNIAKPMRHKLGASKPVWSHDEWFKESLGEDRALKDAEEDAALAQGDDTLAPMDSSLENAKATAKQKGLYTE
mmetsp:Transcript_23168/g.47369  ORF Transcript_23168/g.47369 Transcript_23168/m.47369 type:complete len:85 (-) Transcript_23168:228-482(-)